MWPKPQVPADLVTFTEEIRNGKLHILFSVALQLIPTLNMEEVLENQVVVLEQTTTVNCNKIIDERHGVAKYPRLPIVSNHLLLLVLCTHFPQQKWKLIRSWTFNTFKQFMLIHIYMKCTYHICAFLYA